jgi:hypothetical protein
VSRNRRRGNGDGWTGDSVVGGLATSRGQAGNTEKSRNILAILPLMGRGLRPICAYPILAANDDLLRGCA